MFYSDLNVNKLHVPRLSLFCSRPGECSLPALLSTHEPFVVFSVPCPAEEGSDRVALVGISCPATTTLADCQVTHVGLLSFCFSALISTFPHFHSFTQNFTKNVLCKVVKPHLSSAGVNQTDETQAEQRLLFPIY